MTTPLVSVIMPCKGRPAQTAHLIPRLIAHAGNVPWELICVVDDDPEVVEALAPFRHQARIIPLSKRHGYWKALAVGSQHARGAILANIANDVLPGLSWLSRAVQVMQRHFPDNRGVVGWNDALCFDGHTGHVLIGRVLAEEWYGSLCWPTVYDHLFGDTEICQRAIERDQYLVAVFAVLFHNHPVIGQAVDGVYQFSHTHQEHDGKLFAMRRSTGWPALPSA